MDYGIKSLNTFELVVKSESDRTFEGFVTVETVDQQGEITVRDELLKTMDTWLSRGGPMSYGHSNKIVGKGLGYESTVYKVPDSGEEKAAIKIKGKVFSDTVLDDIVWAGLKNGTLKGLSYGGATRSPKEAVVQADGSLAYKLKNLEVYEVAICERPVNNYALITSVNSVAKSYPNLKKGYERDDGMAAYQCDGVRCMVEKAEEKTVISPIISTTDKNMTDTPQTESITREEVSELITQGVTKGISELLTSIRKEEEEEQKTSTEEESEGEEMDKGFVDKADFEKLVNLVSDYVEKSEQRIEALEKDAGDKPKLGEKGPGEEKSNNEKEVLPDEDSTQATMNPTNDNSTDEVKVAKGNKEGEAIEDVVKSERPEIVDTIKSLDQAYDGNPIIDDVKKGIPMQQISEKIRLHQYEGMQQEGLKIEL